MDSEKTMLSQLKEKYIKIDEVKDFRELLYHSAEKYRTENAFRLKDGTGKIYGVTYEKFKEDVVAVGTKLLDLGFEGKTIAVMGKNSYEWAVSYLAISIIGIVVPIDKELHINDVSNFLNAAESVAIIADEKYITMLIEEKEKINNKELLYINIDNSTIQETYNFNDMKEAGKELIKDGDTTFDDIKIDPDSLHILLFTSGTTGNAKGVELSQTNIISNILSTRSVVEVTKEDQVLSILPIHHTYECTLGYLLVIYSGACIAYCEGLKYITKNIEEFKPTIILCVPLLLENVHKKISKTIAKILTTINQPTDNCSIDKLPFFVRPIVKKGIKKSLGGRMKKFIVGAAPINPMIVEEFYKFGIPTLQGYGLTECSPLVVGNNDFFHKAESAGMAIPNVEYQIENPDENGVGEIIVKGPNVMLGYYKDPAKTAEVMKNGWFHTGDLGKIDEDGFLYITGRCKTVIVTKNGKNIYPEEIEYYLNESPLVEECIVIGAEYENDDETYVNAQIYPDIEAIKTKLKKDNLTEEEIKECIGELIQNVNKMLPNYKHIKKYNIRTSEFEKTTTKKIKRFGDNLKIY